MNALTGKPHSPATSHEFKLVIVSYSIYQVVELNDQSYSVIVSLPSLLQHHFLVIWIVDRYRYVLLDHGS